jgi:hypothetical protein
MRGAEQCGRVRISAAHRRTAILDAVVVLAVDRAHDRLEQRGVEALCHSNASARDFDDELADGRCVLADDGDERRGVRARRRAVAQLR